MRRGKAELHTSKVIHYFPSFGSKQLCALEHLGCNSLLVHLNKCFTILLAPEAPATTMVDYWAWWIPQTELPIINLKNTPINFTYQTLYPRRYATRTFHPRTFYPQTLHPRTAHNTTQDITSCGHYILRTLHLEGITSPHIPSLDITYRRHYIPGHYMPRHYMPRHYIPGHYMPGHYISAPYISGPYFPRTLVPGLSSSRHCIPTPWIPWHYVPRILHPWKLHPLTLPPQT